MALVDHYHVHNSMITVSGWLSEALPSTAAVLMLERRRPFITLMDGRPVLNVTCYDHINLPSVPIDITLLPLGLSQSVSLHCKFRLEEPRCRGAP